MLFKPDNSMCQNLTKSDLYIIFDTVIDNATHIPLEIHLRRIPTNTTRVGEIKRFLPIPEGFPIQSGLVELKNGTVSSSRLIAMRCDDRLRV